MGPFIVAGWVHLASVGAPRGAGDMGTHGGEPFRCIKDLPVVAVVGCINDRSFVFEVLRPFLGEGGPDDVACEVFHRRCFFRPNALAAKDVETGVPPP